MPVAGPRIAPMTRANQPRTAFQCPLVAQSGLTSTILCLSAFGAKPTCTVVKLAPPDRERGTQTAAMCSRCDRSLRQRYAARDLQAQRRDPSRH